LPAEFHTLDSFNKSISILKTDLRDLSSLSGKIDAPLLFLELMYQEVCRSMEIEPDAPTKAPNHLVKSPFGIKEVQKIESLLKSVRLPSEK
jgi:hypothetical protein